MAQVSYPDVYIQEVPSGVRTITNVGTSITAFVDFFAEGPMNLATEIFGLSDFGRVFGGIDARSDASYAIAQFFLNSGSDAIVVRSHSGTVAHPLAAATVNVFQSVAAAVAMTITARSEGAWGNTLRADVDHRTADPTKFFNLTITRYASSAANAAAIGQEQYLNVTLDPASSRDVVKILASDSKLVHATVPVAAVAAMPASNGTVGAALPGRAGAATPARWTLGPEFARRRRHRQRLRGHLRDLGGQRKADAGAARVAA